MKKFMKLALTSFALLAFGISSCGESPAPSGPDYSHNNKLVESVTLSEDYLTCSIGDSFELFAEIKFKDDEKVDISKRWASSKTSVARITPDYENDTCFAPDRLSRQRKDHLGQQDPHQRQRHQVRRYRQRYRRSQHRR